MKHSLLLLASLLLISGVGSASEVKTTEVKKTATKAKTKTVRASQVNQAQLGTSFRFDGSSLHGKFQSAPSTVATVENDKFLEDLIGARKNFKDRERQDDERN
jgi:hypothetical protein